MNTPFGYRHLAAGLLALAGLAAPATAQNNPLKIPALSQGQRIEQDFGLGTVSVKYFRPNAQGRKIFGGMEPYGNVWRTGANNATVISFTDTVTMDGHTVPPGSYALFTIPGASSWTIILNNDVNQWGAYDYDQKKDFLRFQAKPARTAAKVETFAIQFADVQQEDCELQLQWDNTSVTIHLHTNVEDRVLANIREAMKGEKKPYYRAAVWYYKNGKDAQQALAWIQEADKQQPAAYNIKYWLAKLQLKTGDKPAAIASAREGLRLAEAEKSDEYIRMNKEVLKEAGAK